MQIKITIGYHFTPTWMANIKKWKIRSGDEVKKLEPSNTALGNEIVQLL